MRTLRAPSEVRRLTAPALALASGAWERMHWWIGGLTLLYALSGITIVKPDEVAVVLRWGKLVGASPALQQHGSGLLLALPRPIDQVVRVRTRRVEEQPVSTLATVSTDWTNTATLDPVTDGYALTGDRNVVQVDMVARYRVREPAVWALYGPPEADVLRNAAGIAAATA